MSNKNWGNKYGSWAVITGASSGLGCEFALQFANEYNMNIVLIARREDRLKQTADAIKASSPTTEVLIISQDLTAPDAITNIKQAIGEREIGVLVNNAGFGLIGKFHELDTEKQKQMAQLNCVVPVIMSQLVLPQMTKRQKGAIIFLASTAAYQATPFFSVYGASKGFNLQLGEALWAEYKNQGIDVLALSPGYTKTEFHDVAGMNKIFGKAATAADVVKLACKNLGKKPSIIHGQQNSLMATMGRMMPRKFLVNCTEKAMRKLI